MQGPWRRFSESAVERRDTSTMWISSPTIKVGQLSPWFAEEQDRAIQEGGEKPKWTPAHKSFSRVFPFQVLVFFSSSSCLFDVVVSLCCNLGFFPLCMRIRAAYGVDPSMEAPSRSEVLRFHVSCLCVSAYKCGEHSSPLRSKTQTEAIGFW